LLARRISELCRLRSAYDYFFEAIVFFFSVLLCSQVPCPAGTFGAREGLGTARCSGLCAPGHFCPPGSVSATEVPSELSLALVRGISLLGGSGFYFDNKDLFSSF